MERELYYTIGGSIKFCGQKISKKYGNYSKLRNRIYHILVMISLMQVLYQKTSTTNFRRYTLNINSNGYVNI